VTNFNEARNIGRWYVNAYRSAFGSASAILPSAAPLALKLLEEVVELCIAAGTDFTALRNCFSNVWNKEKEKEIFGLKKSDADMRQNIVEEMADCRIVMSVYQHLLNVAEKEIRYAIQQKMDANLKRQWRVNAFGSLSHVKPTSEK
jgi:hypothetical protein